MKVGDRIRYIGHTPKCLTCVQAGKSQPQPVVMDGTLDDRDEFGLIDFVWDSRIGKTGKVREILGWDLDTVSVHLDGEASGCKPYIDHLEVIS